VGNNPLATGSYKSAFPIDLSNLADQKDKFSSEAGRLAVDYILQNPGIFLVNAVKKTANVLRSEGELLVWAFHADMRSPETSFSEKYRSIPLAVSFPVNLGYFAMMVLGVVGLVRWWKDDFTSIAFLFATVLFAVHAVFFGSCRFHFLLMPFLVISSARVLPELRSLLNELSRPRMVILLFILSALFGIWAYEFVAVF
jgi:hypothetical protein